MRASYKWLRELCRFEASPDIVAARLTAAGLEVEGQKRYGDLPGVVVAELRAARPHPERDKLTLVTLFDGEQQLDIVCGAPNVPPPGKRVLFARVGARLPSGLVIAERKLGGVLSRGMICSESELDIGPESDGIFVFDEELQAAPGTSATDALALDDVVFEIALTPNRPDCLGHVGLARELSALFEAPLHLPELRAPRMLREAPATAPAGTRPLALFSVPAANVASGPATSTYVALRLSAPERCPRYATASVDGVTVGRSPFWLRYRLHVLGSRSISSVVDATNLVLFEYGYPTHAFDRDRLRGDLIEVRLAREGERVVTLDGVERTMAEDDLLICDADRALAIAGVMGGTDSGVSAHTTRVLVECAYFDPRSVRRTSRRLGLHTDASHRFERGVDPRAVPGVLARVASLIAELAGGAPTAHGFEAYPVPISPQEIPLRARRVNALLGTSLPGERMQGILCALGCEVETIAEDTLRVRAPTWRPDLRREEDLIEELARVWGYDKLPTEIPNVRASRGEEQSFTAFLRRLKERAAAVGLTEVVNLAFCSPKQLAAARAPTTALRVANPLSEERAVLRTSLFPGLAQNVRHAQRHQVPQASLFELARVFRPSSDVLPEERYQLALILAGTRASWVGETAPYDFYDAKGLVTGIVGSLLRGELAWTLDAELLAAQYPFLHPRRAARVARADRTLGVAGELHPDVVESLELTGPVVYAELDPSALFALRGEGGPLQVRQPSRFPASIRDLAIVVEEAVEAGQVAASLREAGAGLVEAVELFDLYRGGQLETGKKSLAFRMTYRDPAGTLTDQRVDEVHARVVEETRRRFAALLRI